MNTFMKISSAALLAAAVIAPSTGVFAAPSVMMGNAVANVERLSADELVNSLGMGTAAEFKPLLTTASAINVIDIPNVYANGLQKIDGAETGDKADAIKALRAGLTADSSVKSWFTQHKVDLSTVVAIEFKGAIVNVYVNA